MLRAIMEISARDLILPPGLALESPVKTKQSSFDRLPPDRTAPYYWRTPVT
jgi:hypothetical protein